MKQELGRRLLLIASALVFGSGASAQVVINEVQYDQTGVDATCWVELKGQPGMPLSGWQLVGCNGNGGVEFNTINLNGFIPPDGYFVVGQTAAVPNVDQVSPLVDYMNGPDSIKLKQSGVVVDAVGYEPHPPPLIFCGEGSPTVEQLGSNSLARCPDGNDTNDNSADFVLDASPTIGTPNDPSCTPPVPEPHPICDIAADGPDGTPTLQGVYVETVGVAVSASGTFSPTIQEFHITDGNCCVSVFGGAVSPVVQIGDQVRVRGTVAHFNGRTEITSPLLQVTILSSGNPVPPPTDVTTFDLSVGGESFESCVIRVSCVQIVGGDPWPADGLNANILVDDGSGPVTLRIDRDTDVDGSPAPTGPFTVIGAGTQFDTATPFTEGYQIVPRALSDIDFAPGCDEAPCADCGPGPHWIHNPACAAGNDNVPSDALVGVDTNLDCIGDMSLVLTGPLQVHRRNPSDDSQSFPGIRPVDGHLDVIDTEILSMSLTGGGMTLTVGAGLGFIPLAPTFGVVAEQPGDPNQADSFFDVFFEVDLGGGNRLYNQTPLHLPSVIDCVPPHTTFAQPNTCIPLYTHPVPGQGVHVANLVSTRHSTFPRPGACCFGQNCQILTANGCQSQSGIFQGEDTVCDPNPCIPLEPCALCGPGPHWIHTPPCSSGNDGVPSSALVGVDTNLDCVRDMNLVLSGPVLVHRRNPSDDSQNFPGTRPIDGHQDVIDTEILSMSLTGGGVILTAGNGMGSIPLGPSFGAIAEQPSNPNLADSFFDVFFEVDLGGGNRLYNQSPLQINSVIDCVPPQAIYQHPNICIPLYTHPSPGQGVHVANLVTANHTTFPGTGACCIGTTCVVVSQNECLAQSGDYKGDDVACSPDLCVSGIAESITIRPLDGSVEVAWAVAPADGVLEVRVYRGTRPDIEPELLAAVKAPERQSYRDDSVQPGETYYYWLEPVLSGGPGHRLGPWTASVASRVAVLLGNVPNPLSGETTIRFYTPAPASVGLEVYDASGRLVRTVENRAVNAGSQGILWNGRDAQGRAISPGIYQYKLKVGSAELIGRLTVIR